jgi:gamma-F420-2:alpha-L-glutamate ligase
MYEEYEIDKLFHEIQQADLTPMIMDPNGFDIIVNRGSTKSIRYQGNIISLPSLVLSRTGSGSSYFTLALLRQLEKFNVPVINSSDSVGLVADKLLTSQVLSKENIPQPKTILVNQTVDVDLVAHEIGFPCVVKATKGSKGKTVHLCNTRNAFRNLMDFLSNLGIKKTLIIQQYVDTEIGADLRVWVLDGQPLVAMKRTGPPGDFRANISNGGSGIPYVITDSIADISVRTANALGLRIAGIDLLFGENGFLVCEANSNPGFEGIDTYCNFNMAARLAGFVNNMLKA